MAISYTPGAGGSLAAGQLSGNDIQIVQLGAADDDSGVLTHSRLSVGATEDATTVKASAGTLIGGYISNINASVRYFKLYNKASNPAPASDSALLKLRFAVPANGRIDIGAALGAPVYFSTGIAYVLVTGVADTDVAEVAANDLIVNLTYV